jgi:hypothetical protein
LNIIKNHVNTYNKFNPFRIKFFLDLIRNRLFPVGWASMMGTGCPSPTDQSQCPTSPEMLATGIIEAGVSESGIRTIAPCTARTLGRDAFSTTIRTPEPPGPAGRARVRCDPVILPPDGQGELADVGDGLLWLGPARRLGFAIHIGPSIEQPLWRVVRTVQDFVAVADAFKTPTVVDLGIAPHGAC